MLTTANCERDFHSHTPHRFRWFLRIQFEGPPQIWYQAPALYPQIDASASLEPLSKFPRKQIAEDPPGVILWRAIIARGERIEYLLKRPVLLACERF